MLLHIFYIICRFVLRLSWKTQDWIWRAHFCGHVETVQLTRLDGDGLMRSYGHWEDTLVEHPSKQVHKAVWFNWFWLRPHPRKLSAFDPSWKQAKQRIFVVQRTHLGLPFKKKKESPTRAVFFTPLLVAIPVQQAQGNWVAFSKSRSLISSVKSSDGWLL